MPTDILQEKYQTAARFAAEAHQGQVFPGTELPYLLHISLVAMEVMAALAEEPGRDEDTQQTSRNSVLAVQWALPQQTGRNNVLAVQCALLHDTVEDTSVTVEQLEQRFGSAVADGVAALTKDMSLPKDQRMADSLARICQQPPEVWMVKLADRIVNLAPPPPYWSREKCLAYQAEAREIHAALAPASDYLAARLLEKIEAYPNYIPAGDKKR